MTGGRIAIWRRWVGGVSAWAGCLLFACACLMYLRYAAGTDPAGMHIQERLQHARALSFLWNVSFRAAPLLFMVSLFGFGLRRWIGLVMNVGAFIFDLMILGALCGPFGC